MKNLIIVLCLTLSWSSALFAQRLDDHKFAHQYVQLPLTPLQGDFKTYSVSIDPGTINLAKMGMIESSMKTNYFGLENYTYQEEGGDFLIAVKLDGDHYVSKTVKKKEETKGKGDAAKTVTTYSYDVKFRIPVMYQILDGKREVMVDKIYSGYDRHFTKSFGGTGNVKTLEKSWENSGDATLDGWIKAEFANQLRSLTNHLVSQFDTRPAKTTLTFYGIKKADKIGYEDFAAGVPLLQSVVEGATPEAPLTSASFGENVALWENALQNADPDDKKESVAFQAAAYNLAHVYMLTNDHEKALATANRLSEPGRRDYLVRTILPILEKRQTRYVANQNVPSTYHATYDAEAAGIYESAQMAQRQTAAAAAPTAPSNEGYVVLKNGQDTLRGIITDDYKEIKGTDGGKNFKGVYVEDMSKATSAKRYLEVDEFIYIHRNDMTLFPVRIGIGPITIMTLQEPVYGTTGLVLNRLDESEGGAADYSYWLVHAATNRKGETVKKVYGLDDGMAFFNLNKFLSNKFEDCSIIMAKAASKEYEANGTSYRQIIDDYAECKGTEVHE